LNSPTDTLLSWNQTLKSLITAKKTLIGGAICSSIINTAIGLDKALIGPFSIFLGPIGAAQSPVGAGVSPIRPVISPVGAVMILIAIVMSSVCGLFFLRKRTK
jgi:hypothetical protein